MRHYIDVHCHIGQTVSRAPAVGQSVGRYLARMADSRVVAAILSPTAGGPQAGGVLDTRRQNEAIASACRLFPRRFPIGLAVVEVRHLEPGVRELVRAMDEDGLQGFMVHPGLSGHALGGELHPFLEEVAARRGLCLLHQAGSTRNIAACARRFPDVTFIIGHVSMNRAAHLDAIEHCGELDNVWYDVAQKPEGADPSWDLAHLTQNLSRERLLFGSDAPYYDYRRVQRIIETSDLDESTKDAIAHQNAVGLIQRFRPEWAPDTTDVAPPQRYSEQELWAVQHEGSPRLL